MTYFSSLGRSVAAALLLLAAAPAALAQTGGVGVGTSAPDASAALDIVSSSKGVLLPRVASAAALATPATGLLVFQTGAPAGFYYNAGTPGAPSWQQLTTATGAAVTASNGLTKTGADITLGGTFTGATTIDQAGNDFSLTGGNVGIGTTAPGHPLTVQAPADDTRLLGFNNSAGADKYNFSLTNGGLNLSESFVASGRLFVRDGGNVGIGTAAPTQRLEVAGQVFSSAAGFRFPDNTVQTTAASTPTANNGLTKTGNNVALGGALAGATTIAQGGNNFSLTGGNVGIGTSTPGQKLDVTGNTNVSGNSYVSGNVGIGTSTPAQKLDVTGNTNVSGNTNVGGNTNVSGNTNVGGNSYVGGTVGIGTAAPHASAALDVTSTTKGLLPPRLSQAQRDAIAGPAAGLTLYNTLTNKINVWNGTAWTEAMTAAEAPFQNPAQTFGYTGGPQTYTVPPNVTSLQVDAAGGQGGNYANMFDPGAAGGNGGRTQATLAVTPGEVLTVSVGGAGSQAFPNSISGGGWNGGGNGFNSGGGGASDLRRGGTALANRILVAAGGGGASFRGGAGGSGGGLLGGTGGGSKGGFGGTQTGGGAAGDGGGGGSSYGSLGTGGSGIYAGGGGGYYGGGVGGYSTGAGPGGGGGGSSWVGGAGAAGAVYSAGVNAGAGTVTITPGLAYAAPALSGANFVNVPGTWTENGPSVYRAGGSVGIGTAAPGHPLVVQASSGGAMLGFNTSAGTDKYNFSLTNSGLNLSESNVAGGRWFVQDATGNVGIGTSSPAQKLDVAGNATVSGSLGIGTTAPGHPLTVQADGGGKLLGLNTAVGADKYNWSLTNGGLNLSESFVAAGRIFVQDGTGNVGIGTTNPGQKLTVIGAICASLGVNCSSDGRYKREVVPVAGALASMLKLRGVTYYWKQAEFPDKQFPARRQLGFIAQEIEPYYPEMVTTDADGYKSVDYSRLTPVLVEALKKQQQQIEALKAEAATAKAELQTVKAQTAADKTQATAALETFEARLRRLEATGGQAQR